MTDHTNRQTSEDSTRSGAEPRALLVARFSALLLLCLGFLPIVNWIAGGHAAEWYRPLLADWANGAVIVLGGGIVLAILSRRLPIWRDALGASWAELADAHPIRTCALIGVGAAALYGAIAVGVLSGRPIFIDEMSQLFQARVFAGGRLWLDAPQYPEFTSIMHVLDGEGKWYSQFPFGGPLMMVPAVLLGASWLAGPMAGAAAAASFWGIARRIEPRKTVALGASILYACAPFVAFLAGSHMNHVATAAFVLTAIYALVRLDECPSSSPESRVRFAALCGVSLGMAATVRPVDALAFALPAGVWLLARARYAAARRKELLAAGVAIAIPVGAMLAYNEMTTGAPLLFAYEKLWGMEHGLGFHRSPWGAVHSPVRGLELINLYLLRLQTYLFESPIPSLAAATMALLLTRRVGRVDRYLLASGGLLLLLYFAYWHDGFYLGPRFIYLLTPIAVLWTARLPSVVRDRWGGAHMLHRGVVFSLLLAGVLAVGTGIPARAAQYAGGLASTRREYTAIARDAGVNGALIFVRESWGTQLMARLWSVGISRSESERLYRNVDACRLDEELDRIERQGRVRGDSARALLQLLLVDSSRVVRSTLSPDPTERMLPGARYGARCQRRIAEDIAGFTLFAPLLAEDWGSNVYARDLHARDSLLVTMHPGRAVYLLRPTSSEPGSPPQLHLLSVDSLMAAWRHGE